MPPLRHVLAVSLLLLGSLASPANAQRTEQIRYRSADGTMLTADLIRAVGTEERSPVVIALHGCGGPLNRARTKLGSRHHAWARLLANAGYTVIFPNSFGSRGHASLCKIKPRPVRQADRVSDVQGTLDWLAQQDFADRKAISVLGWSNGGTTALWTASKPFSSKLKQIIAFYPGCRLLVERNAPKPATKVKILIGAADDWTLPSHCKTLADKWQMPIKLFDGAYHGFDSPNSRVRERSGLAFTPGGTGKAHVGTNHPARRKAIAEVLMTLSAD